ncbi:MAG: hypothetical protein FJY77_01385 [Candidatus Altiarchaeales archaeon]|nr:hypothetical protein [Candidatus Altiarchaeales archaeon]
MDLIKEAEAKLYSTEAGASFSAGKYAAAAKSYKKAAELYLSMQKVLDAALAYRKTAESYHKIKAPLKEEERKNVKEAVSFYSLSAENYGEGGDYLNAGDGYENAAKLSDEVGDLNKAVEYSLKSVLAYTKSGDQLSISHAYLYTARYYEKMGRMEEAAGNYERAGEINLQISDNRRSASNYVSAAECYKKVGKVDKAISALANSVNANLKLREYSKIAETYEQMAELYMQVGDFKNSVYYHKKAAELSFDNKDYSAVGLSYFRMGALYDVNKDYENALKYYLESAEASLKAKNYDPASFSYEKVGECYGKLGDTLKASEYYVYSAKTSISAGKTQDALRTYTKAANNFIEHAEAKLLEKDYENAALFYAKAVDCYAGLEDFQSAGEIYMRRAETYMKAGEKQKANENYILAAESFLKAGGEKTAGYAYKLGGEYQSSASCYFRYAEKNSMKNKDIEAAEGYLLAARAYVKIGADAERRNCYTKSLFHYEKVTKDSKSSPKLKADVFEKMGECYIDISDLRRAESHFQQAANLYKEIKYELGLNLSTALLDRVKGQSALELGEHAKAVEMLKNSFNLFENLLNSGKFDSDFSSYLKEHKNLVESLIYKIEIKPDIEMLCDKHSYTFSDTVLVVNGILNNNGQYSINSISFLFHLPEDFEVVKLPKDIKELNPKESVKILAEILIKRPGEYVVKPFEIFYRDERGNKYVKSSSESIISVGERPPEDFKNFRLAVEVYTRYAEAQLLNKNYFYAGDGFKKAAEIYGKFNQDEKVRGRYMAAVDAYFEYVKSQPDEMTDMVLISRLGDAFWNIAECYESTGDFENSLENYRKAISHYLKSNTQDKLNIGNALVAGLEAKKAIEHGEYSVASEMLSNSMTLFNEALKKGGLSAAQLSLIEKHNAESKMLVEKIRGTPIMTISLESPSKISVNQRFTVKALLTNPGDITLSKIRFMLNFPEGFTVEKAPTQSIDLLPKNSQTISLDLTAKKVGEYTFKPLEVSYTDDRNNNYKLGSSQIMISVSDKPVEVGAKEKLADSGERPRVEVTVKKPSTAVVGVKIVLEGVIENSSSATVNNIRFLANFPQEFEVTETPEVIPELGGMSRQEISFGVIPQKAGEYTLTPLEIFYRDAHGNRYFKSSNEVKMHVISR